MAQGLFTDVFIQKTYLLMFREVALKSNTS
jgi:hypothetical protein